MDDVRWFAPNRYCTLPVPLLRQAGVRIALDRDDPARLAIASDGKCAVQAFEYSSRHRAPLILYLWDLPPWWLGQGRPDFIFFAGGRIRRVPRWIGGYPHRAGFLSRIRYVARRALQVWAPSRCTQESVRRQFGVDARQVPFCYDSSRFRAPPEDGAARGAEPPILLAISRLVPHKNHQLLVRAAARLVHPVQVRIIGQGPEAEPLRRLATDLGVALSLTDAWASDEEILAAYRTASVVVSPSRFEGFGLTPLEGLAMRRPVLVSDIPPHREFAGEAVRFFDPDDVAGLAAALAAVLDHPTRPVRPATLDAVTIEACAERFLAGLEMVLQGMR